MLLGLCSFQGCPSPKNRMQTSSPVWRGVQSTPLHRSIVAAFVLEKIGGRKACIFSRKPRGRNIQSLKHIFISFSYDARSIAFYSPCFTYEMQIFSMWLYQPHLYCWRYYPLPASFRNALKHAQNWTKLRVKRPNIRPMTPLGKRSLDSLATWLTGHFAPWWDGMGRGGKN